MKTRKTTRMGTSSCESTATGGEGAEKNSRMEGMAAAGAGEAAGNRRGEGGGEHSGRHGQRV